MRAGEAEAVEAAADDYADAAPAEGCDMIAMRAAVAAAYPIIAAAVTAERAAGDRRALDEARAKVAALCSALERTEQNFVLAVCGKPVRDMGETLAENLAALAAAQPTESAPR